MLSDSTRYNVEGGIWEFPFGGRMWNFKFGKKEAYDFGRRVGSDPLQFLRQGNSTDVFLVEMIKSSLSGDRDFIQLALETDGIIEWLERADQQDEDFDEDMMKFAFLYLYALGRPKKQRGAILDFCDLSWEKSTGSRPEWEGKPNPFLPQSRGKRDATPNSNGQPLPASVPGSSTEPAQTGS